MRAASPRPSGQNVHGVGALWSPGSPPGKAAGRDGDCVGLPCRFTRPQRTAVQTPGTWQTRGRLAEPHMSHSLLPIKALIKRAALRPGQWPRPCDDLFMSSHPLSVPMTSSSASLTCWLRMEAYPCWQTLSAIYISPDGTSSVLLPTGSHRAASGQVEVLTTLLRSLGQTSGSHLQGLCPICSLNLRKPRREDRCCPRRADNEIES